MKIRNNPRKPLALVLMAALCYGCGSVSGNNNESGNEAPSELLDPLPFNNGPKVITISRTSVIPTNTGAAINHKLKVDNFTGKNLKLVGFNISGSARTSTLAKAYNQARKMVGYTGYDARVNLASCETLPEGGSCNIGFTPDEKNGSTSIQLIFEDETARQYLASQLVEYSSVVNKDNGFYVSNANIGNVASTNAYSLSIPFVSDDDYDRIEVNSEVMTISKSVSCERGIKKNGFCTALVTLPAGPVNHYNNQITIRGIKVDGSTRAADLSTGNTYNDFAHLTITQGPVLINEAGNFKSSVKIVNDGAVDAINVKSDVILGSAWFNGVQTPAEKNYLDQAQTCDGEEIDLATGGHMLASGSACDLEFSLSGNYLDATGSNDYRLIYELGSAGAAPIASTTKLYYTGRSAPQYAYILLGNVDFGDVGIKTSQSRMITVENKGTEGLHGFELEGIPNGLPLSLDVANSSCLTKTATASLPPGQQCSLQIKYEPTEAVNKTSFTLKVKAKKAGTDPSVSNSYVEPVQERTVTYAAVNGGGNGLVITPANHGISIIANGLEERVSTIRVQNLSQDNPYILNKVQVAKEYTFPMSNKLTVTGKDIMSGSEFAANNTQVKNPFAGITLSSAAIATLDASTYTLEKGEIGELSFNYGPTTTIENGLLSVVFTGGFDGQSVFDTSHITQYRATTGTVTTTDPTITKPDGNSLTDVITDAGDNAFVLTHENYPKVTFTYQFSDVTYGFVINDANLPFGWLPDAASTCPRTSDGKTSDPTMAVNKGRSCTYVATFMDPKKLAHALYYEAATSQFSTLKAPGYTFYNTKGDTPNGTLNVITDSGKSITINPKPFMDMSVTKTMLGENEVGYMVDVTFTVSKMNATLGLTSQDVEFKPVFASPENLNPEGAQSCTASVGKPCTITTTLKKGKSENLPYIAASTDNGTYNARNGAILLSN